eukprot:tig00001065_g6724.t1
MAHPPPSRGVFERIIRMFFPQNPTTTMAADAFRFPAPGGILECPSAAAVARLLIASFRSSQPAASIPRGPEGRAFTVKYFDRGAKYSARADVVQQEKVVVESTTATTPFSGDLPPFPGVPQKNIMP